MPMKVASNTASETALDSTISCSICSHATSSNERRRTAGDDQEDDEMPHAVSVQLGDEGMVI